MKTFFKNLQNLSSKKVSFKKYLLYALGEMLLIVLSLLLALYLNQLKKDYNDKEQRLSYYKMMIQDYQSDLNQLKIAEKSFQKELNLITNYSQRLNNSKASTDTLIQIVRHEYNPNIPPFVRFTSTTIETIKQTGRFNLIDNQIIQQINALETLQDEQKLYQNITLESQSRLLEQYLSNYPLPKGEINKGALYESLWLEVDNRQLLLDFNALITITRSALNNALYYYKKIEIDTQKIIDAIEEKVK